MTMDGKTAEQTLTSAELVRGALAGDGDAWEKLVRRYDGSLRRAARSFRVDPATAEDAVQTTWLRLVEHLDSLRDPDRVGSWLLTTLRRQIISALSAPGRGPRLVGLADRDPAAPDLSPEEVVTAQDRDDRTKAALNRLPARNRALLTLLMAAELSYGGGVRRAADAGRQHWPDPGPQPSAAAPRAGRGRHRRRRTDRLSGWAPGDCGASPLTARRMPGLL